MNRKLTKKLCGLIWVIVAFFPLSVWALDPIPADSLNFRLSDSTAFIINTVTDDATQIAEITFSVKYDGSWSGTLQRMDVEFSYDSSKVIFDTAIVDPNWNGGVSSTDDLAGKVNLIFDQGSVTTFDTTGYTVYGYLRFHLKCQDELSSSNLILNQDGFRSNLTFNGGFIYYPADSSNFDDGSLTTADYQATFAFHDSTFSNSCQETVILPVYATTNYKTFVLKQWIVYNQEKLQIQDIIYEAPWSFQPTFDTSRADTIVTTMLSVSGAPEFNDEPAYRIVFKLLEALQSDTALISFYPDSSWSQVAGCAVISVGETYPDIAVVSLTDSAAYKAVYTGGSVGKDDHGDTLDFYLLLQNSFVAGIADGQSADTGVIINAKFGRNLNLSGIDIIYESVKFTCREQGDSLVSIYQTYDSGELNYINTSNSFDTLMKLNVLFDAGSFVPDWNDRFLHPKFINTYGDAYGTAVVPDTIGCIEADSINGQLRFWGADSFDSVAVEMGNFVLIGTTSIFPCTYLDFYVRSTFDLDSFDIDLSVSTYNCIFSVTDKMTGVVAAAVDSVTWNIHTNSIFATVDASDTLIKVCRIHVGIKGSCLPTKGYGISVTPSNAKMWDDGGVEHFVDADGGSGTAKCSGSGNGCSSCGIGGPPPTDPDLKVADETGLPTEFALLQNYPNPFNPVTTILFDLPVATEFELIIFNVLGQQVKTFIGYANAGQVVINWDAGNNASGVYLYKLIAGDFNETRKMLLLK